MLETWGFETVRVDVSARDLGMAVVSNGGKLYVKTKSMPTISGSMLPM